MNRQTGKTPVAAFDFDGTLTNGDTLLPFLRRTVGAARLLRGLVLAQAAWRFDGEHGREQAKRKLLASTLRGVPENHLAAVGARYAKHVFDTQLRSDVADRLEDHRDAGHQLVIVSASLAYYLDPLAELFGVPIVICCRLTTDTAGRSTGCLAEENLRGEVKAERLRALLGPAGMLAYAYGNDPLGDGPMLEMAKTPILVGSTRLPPLGCHSRLAAGSGSLQVGSGTIAS